MKLFFFQIWSNNMRGLTMQGANSNDEKRAISKKLLQKYPDCVFLGNGWHVFRNVSNEDVTYMQSLADKQYRSFTFETFDANTDELFFFLKEKGYLHEFKRQLPFLIKKIDHEAPHHVAPDGFENPVVSYMLVEDGKADRVIVAEKEGKRYIWAYPVTGYKRQADKYYIYQNENSEWVTWDGKQKAVRFI